jgi:hypothetical protein
MLTMSRLDQELLAMRHPLRISLLVAAALLCAQAGASAQENLRQAIAYAQAVEMSAGVCAADTLEDAVACARDRCVDGGGTLEACEVMAACYPGGWSVDVFVQIAEGPHWHEFHCGWISREQAIKAVEAVCDRTLRPDLIECSAVELYDEGGAAHPLLDP